MTTSQTIQLLMPIIIAILGSVITAVVAFVGREIALHVRNQRVRAEIQALVLWAQQVIPATSDRYSAVAAIVARTFTFLTAAEVQQLIESCVATMKITLGQNPAAHPTVAGLPTTGGLTNIARAGTDPLFSVGNQASSVTAPSVLTPEQEEVLKDAGVVPSAAPPSPLPVPSPPTTPASTDAS